jgi:hypothetical protein
MLKPEQSVELRILIARMIEICSTEGWTADEVLRHHDRIEKWIDQQISDAVTMLIAPGTKIEIETPFSKIKRKARDN